MPNPRVVLHPRWLSLVAVVGVTVVGTTVMCGAVVGCGARVGGGTGSEELEVDAANSSVASPNQTTTHGASDEDCAAALIEGTKTLSGVRVCNADTQDVSWPDLLVGGLAASCEGAGRGERLVGSCDDDGDCPSTATCVVADHVCEEAPGCDSAADCESGEACFCANAAFDHATSGQNHANVCLPAQCESSADCGTFACAISVDPCRRYAGAYCHTAQDECETNDDCPDHTYRCAFAAAGNKWKCEPFAICQ